MKIKSATRVLPLFVFTLGLMLVGCETTHQTQAESDQPKNQAALDESTSETPSDPAAAAARQEAMNLAMAETNVETAAEPPPSSETTQPEAPAPVAADPAPAPAEPSPAPEKVEAPEPAPAVEASAPPPVEATNPPEPAPAVAEPTPAASPKPAEAKADETPVSAYIGHVAVVNSKKSFVVIDFQQTGVPPVRSAMGVYRDNQFVGSIRITPPIKGAMATADILTGTLRRGDVVR